ncbi:MAG: bifunctional enoyl-CoA hydratase/phosphate acetyltransferase [Caedimonadaceae bacterium]|nr:MAG: bifunctional enoyl-CoA hydratase/phosphate acetyltransferase [Caedimonadaceae bacterium]
MSEQSKILNNITFDEIVVGQSACLTRKLTEQDISLFALVSGDVNPAHLNKEFAEKSFFHGIIGHGMWSGALISTVLGTVLPGPGTVYLEQDMRFRRPVRVGDSITVRISVKSKDSREPIVTFDCVCLNQMGEIVVEGTASVLAPIQKVSIESPSLPAVQLYSSDHYEKVIHGAKKLGMIRVAVVHPVTKSAIQAVIEASEQGLINPILVGPASRIIQAAKENGTDLSKWQIIDTEHSHAAARKSVEMAVAGEVDAIMKGSLHTDELLEAIVNKESGLRTERRISHAYVIDTPIYHKPLIITDAAINIAPSLNDKADICRNAIGLWQSLFNHNAQPKVALLSAVETVTDRMPSTLDAACLCKMAERGQITGAILDGPLAFDNIISKQAADDKGIVSEVAGDADIIVVPNIESGNALAKQLTFLGHAEAAGIVLGARVPVILTSRADSVRTRMLSCVVALYLTHARKTGKIK